MGLRLVQSETAQKTADTPGERPATTEQRVFDHWVWMLGKNPSRTMLGPKRRAVIERALSLGYDEPTLMMAIDGCAGSRWHAGENDRGTPFDDIELILRDERNIERFSEMGERLHQRAERALQARADEAKAPSSGAPSPEVQARLAQARRELAAKAAGRVLR